MAEDFLLSDDLVEFDYARLGESQLHKVLENIANANLKIVGILKARKQKEEEEEEEGFGIPGEEEEEEVPLDPAMPSDLAPMTGGIKDGYYVLNVTVSKTPDQDWHRGNAWILEEFLVAFFARLDAFGAAKITSATAASGILGVRAHFALKGGRTPGKYTTEELNPIYYFSLKFFFDWLSTRPVAGNLNSQLRLGSDEGAAPDKPGRKAARRIVGYFRSPRLEQYLVVDMAHNPSLEKISNAQREEEAKLRDDTKLFWLRQIADFEKQGIMYPDPKYFRAEEEVRAATIGRAILEF